MVNDHRKSVMLGRIPTIQQPKIYAKSKIYSSKFSSQDGESSSFPGHRGPHLAVYLCVRSPSARHVLPVLSVNGLKSPLTKIGWLVVCVP